MPLDQPTATFLDMLRASGGKPLYEQTVDEARATIAMATQQLSAPAAEVGHVADRLIDVAGGSIAIRIYTPSTAATKALPVVLNYHGGGFALGNLDTHDSISRYYCVHADAVVVGVDYRLAPEHRFPVAVDDSYAALVWVAKHAVDIGGDATRLAVTGDSAGGNLATVMCLLSRARGGPRVSYQALLYPVTDFRLASSYGSHTEFGGGEYFLSIKDMDWFRSLYFRDVGTEVVDPQASPMAEPDLTGLPPALVVTAGCDPLRDEGRMYADRLAAAGVPAEYRCWEGTIHACASFAGAIPAGLDILDFVAARLRAALHSGVTAPSALA